MKELAMTQQDNSGGPSYEKAIAIDEPTRAAGTGIQTCHSAAGRYVMKLIMSVDSVMRDNENPQNH